MLYTYECKGCGHSFEETLPVADRDDPTKKPCPKCGECTVVRNLHVPNLVSGYGSTIGRTDSGWNDTLKRIKKASGRNNTIEIK